MLGVLLGSIMGMLGSRVTTFGLADLRGGLSAGFDEGAWITTSFGVGQMLVGVASPYLGAVFGVRRVLLLGILLFFMTSLLGPLSPNLDAFLAMQFLGGVGSGTFIPLTISFIIRSLPARLVIYGIALYAMNSELSQNVAASLEGWYSRPLVLALDRLAVLRDAAADVRLRLVRHPARTHQHCACCAISTGPASLYATIGFALLYAGLDQGNRLDWSGSGLINGLLLAGGMLTLAVRGARAGDAAAVSQSAPAWCASNLPLLLLLLAGFRFIILSTAYIIPTYLQTVQNFRELQVGDVLLWIALPQFVIVCPLAVLLRRVDARWVLAFGTVLIGVACLMATDLTSEWATEDFLPSQILQAIGQSFALTALIVLIVRSINPADALTIGCLLQISRLFGGEIGTAFMQTFVRVREQVHSNLVGLHVDSIAGADHRPAVGLCAAPSARTPPTWRAAAQAAKLLAGAVRSRRRCCPTSTVFSPRRRCVRVPAAGRRACAAAPPSPF